MAFTAEEQKTKKLWKKEEKKYKSDISFNYMLFMYGDTGLATVHTIPSILIQAWSIRPS